MFYSSCITLTVCFECGYPQVLMHAYSSIPRGGTIVHKQPWIRARASIVPRFLITAFKCIFVLLARWDDDGGRERLHSRWRGEIMIIRGDATIGTRFLWFPRAKYSIVFKFLPTRKNESGASLDIWKNTRVLKLFILLNLQRINRQNEVLKIISLKIELISAFSRSLNYSDRSIGQFRARIYLTTITRTIGRIVVNAHTPFVPFTKGEGGCNWLITRTDRKSWLIEIRKMIDAPLLYSRRRRYPRLCYALSSPSLWNPFSFYYQIMVYFANTDR